MPGVSQIEIKESPEKLRDLMKKQKTALGFAKVQTLYLLKINAVETIRYLAVLVGRGESTIFRWLNQYKTGGISVLLNENHSKNQENLLPQCHTINQKKLVSLA